MNLEESKSKRYVEIYATGNKGTTMFIKKLVEKKKCMKRSWTSTTN